MIKKTSILSAILLLLFSCIERENITVSFDSYSRTVGPEGGTIEFYEGGLPGESGYSWGNNSMVAKLEIPPGALNEEVEFTIRKRSFNLNDELYYDDVWELGPAWVRFNIPVNLSVQLMTDTTSLGTEFFCFAQPLKLLKSETLLEDLTNPSQWEPVVDYEFDRNNFMITLPVEHLNNLYVYGLSSNLVDQDYYFCSQSNSMLELDLGFNSLMAIRENSLPVPSYLKREPFIPPSTEKIRPFIDGYYLLKPKTTRYKISPSDIEFNYTNRIFLAASGEQSQDIWLNWEKAIPDLKILKIDDSTQSIVEVLDTYPDLNFEENFIFGTYISSTGTYELGVPESSFELWQGGRMDITVSGGGTDTTLVIENYDYGGGYGEDILGTEVYVKLNVLTGKDETGGYSRFKIEDLEVGASVFPNSFFEYFTLRYLDVNGNYQTIKYRSGGARLEITRFEKGGGWIEGTLSNRQVDGAYNSLGNDVQLDIVFKIKMATWDEL